MFYSGLEKDGQKEPVHDEAWFKVRAKLLQHITVNQADSSLVPRPCSRKRCLVSNVHACANYLIILWGIICVWSVGLLFSDVSWKWKMKTVKLNRYWWFLLMPRKWLLVQFFDPVCLWKAQSENKTVHPKVYGKTATTILADHLFWCQRSSN